MLDIMHKGLKIALERCDQVEIYGEKSDALSIEVEKGGIKKAKKVKSAGIGVRVVISKKMGFSYTTAIDKIGECVEMAIKQARISEEDEHFVSLPVAKNYHYKEPEKVFDGRIAELDAEEAMKYCKEMLTAIEEFEMKKARCICSEGNFSAGYDEVYVLNSEGIEVEDRGTFVAAGVTVVAMESNARAKEEEEVSAWEGDASRLLSKIDFRWIGEEAARIAVNCLGAKKIETKQVPVVLSPKAVQSLLAYTTIPHLNAENVQRKQSPYVGKIGEEIASETVTIIDDGTMPMGINSRKMDGEGVPSQRTTLVEKGVLKNFLYDSYTAAKDGVESTGNAVRSYDQLPAIGATNFIISRGRASREEIFSDIKEGLFVNDIIGAHTASRASGEFSVIAHNAFEIKRGDLQPVKHVMLSGNMQEVLKNIEIVCNDARQVYNIVSPSIVVSKMQIIS
ncbi:MAG: TldD/PmbA family protein [Candidatus Methanospirareceae archaeon]